jgi:phosphoglycerate dehydrogenase-like enzyme
MPRSKRRRRNREQARVFVTQPIAESALARLREVADVEVNPDSSRVLPKDRLIEAVKRCDILLSLLHDTVDRDVLAANPKLKAVSSMNITQDRIDLAEATARGIPVTNIRRSSPTPPPTSASACCWRWRATSRGATSCFRSGIYPGSQSNHLAGAAVTGRTLGLVGFGRIGQADGAARPRLRHDDHLCRPAPSAAERGGEIRCDLSQLRRSPARGRFRLAASAAVCRRRAT